MSRYIDTNKLIEFINSKFVVSWKHDYDGGFKDACVEILNAIEDAPSIEIVRCRDCKYYIDNTCDCYSLYGDLSGDLIGVYFEPNEDFFCSYGCRDSEKPNNLERSSE